MTLMQGADISELEYSTVGPMQRWIDELNLQQTTFFRAENVVNYELRLIRERDYKVRDPSPTLQAAITEIIWPLTRITVPSRALGILPHFAIVAHEVGHAIYDDLKPIISTSLAKHSKENNSVFDNYYTKLKTRIGSDYDDNQARRITYQILSNWTEEIACDAVAFAMTGPAIFFALSDILQFASANVLFTKTHPPKTLRRAFLYDLMFEETSNFAQIMKDVAHIDITNNFNSILIAELPDIDILFSEYSKMYGRNDVAAVLSELPTVIHHFGPLICEAVVKAFYSTPPYIGLAYRADTFAKDLETHLEPLLMAVPPIESGPSLAAKLPTDFPTILNVGWIVLLSKLENFEIDATDVPEHLRYGAKAEILHRLLLKAVELSEIRRQWQKM